MPTTRRAAALRFEAMAAEYLERMGDRMRDARDAKGLSQSALARLLPGTTDGNQVSRWELGKHRPSDDTLEAIAQALDVDVAYFLAAAPDKSNGTPDLSAGEPADLAERLDRIETKLDALDATLDRVNQFLSALQPEKEEEEPDATGGFRVPELPQQLRDALNPPREAQQPDEDTPRKRGSSDQGA